MKFIVCKNSDEIAKESAKIVCEQVNSKPNSVLGFATGSSPVNTYKEIIKTFNDGKVDFSKVTSFNLDEYYPIKQDDEQSYHYFMFDNLFNHINIPKERIHILNGEAPDAKEECAKYEEDIKKAGMIDLQILGIGRNGHIAFNEPDEKLEMYTHLTSLTPDTIDANKRFFDDISQVPTSAVTMGIGSIMQAKKIILIAEGKAKKDAVHQLKSDYLSVTCPATLLKLHPDVTIICDEEAYN